jgi:hypothetical protein
VVQKVPEIHLFRGIKCDPERGVFADVDRIRDAAKDAYSLAEILRRLGLRPSGSRYAQLRAAMAKNSIQRPANERIVGGGSVFADRAAIGRAVRQSRTQKEALERLGLSLAGKNYTRLVAACTIYRIPVPPKWGVQSQADKHRLERERRAVRWRVLADGEAVRVAVSDAPSWSVAAQRLWKVSDASDREALKARCAELSLRLRGRRSRGILDDREAVAAAVATARSVIEALTALNLSASAHHRLVRACEEYGLRVPRADKAEMARIGHERAKASYRWGRPEDVLKQDSAVSQGRVRNMVLRYDLIPYVCAICATLPEWRGMPLVLILDHKNGDPSDHRLEKLQFACPNCESQLPTHGSRNCKARAA